MARQSRLLAYLLAAALGTANASAEEKRFPTGFLWGTATAAHQVEGNNARNDWWTWEQEPGRIKNGDRSGLACDHYHLYPEDLDRANSLGNNAYRFSLEWSRIEPEEGVFDEGEIAHYRAMVQACRTRGIEPMVTLHHFSLPQWFAAKGGFEAPTSAAAFERFARRMGQELGDLVDLWNTQNEPMVWVAAGYGAGVFPPGKQLDLGGMSRVIRHLAAAHAAAYRALHATDATSARPSGKACEVGIAHHMRVFQPWRWYHPGDQVMSKASAYMMNSLYLDVIRLGRAELRVPGLGKLSVDVPTARGTLDFLGVNYYSRDLIKISPGSPGWIERIVPEGAPVTDMGWEIYPEGFHQVLMEAADYGWPLYVTENGIADANDAKRVDFLRDHLTWMHQAIADGAEIRGYFHWSLLDNFEWAEGFHPRFGLYAVDYVTQERTLRPGGAYYGKIARGNALVDP